MKSILFLSTANGGRSAMAEALARQMFGGSVEIASAGLDAGSLNPAAIDVMKEVNIDISGHVPRQLEPGDLRADLVVVVCGRSPNLDLGGRTRRMHWPLPDPADPGEPGAVVDRFRETRTALSKHLKGIAKLLEGGH